MPAQAISLMRTWFEVGVVVTEGVSVWVGGGLVVAVAELDDVAVVETEGEGEGVLVGRGAVAVIVAADGVELLVAVLLGVVEGVGVRAGD